MSNVNFKIMGDGFISEGEYGNIKIMGNTLSEGNITAELVSDMGDAQFNGNVNFKTLKIMGSMRHKGRLVSKETKVMGSLEVVGHSEIDRLVVNGETVLNGDLKCNNVIVNGQLTITGNLYAKGIKVNGEIRIDGNIESEEVEIDGMIHCKGLLNAENIIISPRTNCYCKEIGASKINVRKPKYHLFKVLFVSGRHGKLESELIEADEIELWYTRANEVKGHHINLIENCKINHVEYSGAFTMSESCTIKTQTKMG